MEWFEVETGWHPERVAVFAGVLLYKHYGFIKRRMMKGIVRNMGAEDTDTLRDYEYAHWDKVQRFAEEFLKDLTRDDAQSAGVLNRRGGVLCC